MADLDIEETNRLRAALGMTLLPTSKSTSNLDFKTSGEQDVDDEDMGSTLDTRQAAAGDNWKRLQDAEQEKKRKEARRAALKKERDAALRFSKLEGKGLGDPADDEVDTRAWLLSSNKRQKKIAKGRAAMLQKELEERENQAQYTEKDLAGQRIAHELGDFDEEGEHILTLKDAAIGEESEDDELENAELRDRERLNERLKLKTQKRVYDPNADTDAAEKSILAQYDEEIDGKKKKHFTLDGYGRTREEATGPNLSSGSRGLHFSLELPEDDKPVSDYVDISEIKIKKPKKKKEKSKRSRPVDDDDQAPTSVLAHSSSAKKVDPEAMVVDTPLQQAVSIKRKHDDMSFVDDEDLQSSLAASRMAALKKRKRARPEDLARQLREEASATPAPKEEMDSGEEEHGLVIDETSEFVANLQKPRAPEARGQAVVQIKREASAGSPTPGEDVAMGSDAEDEDADEGPVVKPDPEKDVMTATGLAEEENLNNAGIGATIGMLMKRGLVKNQDGSGLNASQSAQTNFIRHKERLEKEWERKAQDKRKRDRENGLFERMSKRQQEEYAQQENKNRDQYVSRQLDELFNKEYKPNVELKYIDEFGRKMDSREAFKQMSHQFHGKGSGKQKTEKRLKKIAEEQEREARSSLDGSQVGLNNAAGTQAKRQKAAGVRLQ